MRWAKEQDGTTGYAHSASGLQIDPPAAAKRLIAQSDRDGDGQLTAAETSSALLPDGFPAIDADGDGRLTERELINRIDRAADELPNLVVPEMNGVGAMEICVSTAEGVCDFISAMDTARIQEWNCWYHLELRISIESQWRDRFSLHEQPQRRTGARLRAAREARAR